MRFIKEDYLNEMAYSRSWVIDRLKSLSTPVINHIMKCVVYKNTTNNLNHWINEIADYFDEVNSTIVKTKNGKLKEKDYLENLFYYQGVDERDMRVQLMELRRDRNYPDFEITIELIRRLTVSFNSIAEEFSRIFTSKNSLTKNDFIKILNKTLLETSIIGRLLFIIFFKSFVKYFYKIVLS